MIISNDFFIKFLIWFYSWVPEDMGVYWIFNYYRLPSLAHLLTDANDSWMMWTYLQYQRYRVYLILPFDYLRRCRFRSETRLEYFINTSALFCRTSKCKNFNYFYLFFKKVYEFFGIMKFTDKKVKFDKNG